MTAIAAVGAAFGYVFFSSKAKAAMTAVSGDHLDGYIVDKFHELA